MTAFTLDVSVPFQPGTGVSDLCGPDVGGHRPPHWYEHYGMDFGTAETTPVRTAVDAHVTRYNLHDPAADMPKVCGCPALHTGPDDMMRGYYTHPHRCAGRTHGRHIGRQGRSAGHCLPQRPDHTPSPPALPGHHQHGHRDFGEFPKDGSPPIPGGGVGRTRPFQLTGVRGIQEALTALGYDAAPIDGLRHQ